MNSNLNFANTSECTFENWDKMSSYCAQTRGPQRPKFNIFRAQALETKKKGELVKWDCDRRSLWKFSRFYLNPKSNTTKSSQTIRRKNHKNIEAKQLWLHWHKSQFDCFESFEYFWSIWTGGRAKNQLLAKTVSFLFLICMRRTYNHLVTPLFMHKSWKTLLLTPLLYVNQLSTTLSYDY